jgi:hypothetical protein
MSLAGRILRRLTGQSRPRLSPGSGLIDLDRELPWLHEQVKAYAGMYRVRSTIFQDNFTGETVEIRAAYRHALAEPAVKTALLGKIGSVMALGLQVKPAATAPIDHDVADFVRHALTKCQGGLPELIWSILAGGLLDGWSVNEKVWRREHRGRFAGKISLQKLKAKDTRYIQFEIDPYRNVSGVIAVRGNAGDVFPPSDFVLFKYLSLFENPFGMSDLRAAYRGGADDPPGTAFADNLFGQVLGALHPPKDSRTRTDGGHEGEPLQGPQRRLHLDLAAGRDRDSRPGRPRHVRVSGCDRRPAKRIRDQRLGRFPAIFFKLRRPICASIT